MSDIVTSTDGAVGIITIDRAKRFNALDGETARDLRKAGLLFARDAKIRAVILRGSNGIFCSGADLKYVREGESYGQRFQDVLEYLHSTISEIRRAPKPFIAAVDGPAAAGGFGLAMACDIVVASERAWFEWAYAKTGLTGAESSTFFLPRLVGLRRSMEMLFLNPRLTAQQAKEWGLITSVLSDPFDPSVLSLAHQLAALPTEAVAIAKDLMNQAAGMDRLDMHLDRELEHLVRIANGSNFAEGLSAFFEKRTPAFT